MSEARPTVPEDFSGTVTYIEWSATLLYRRKSGEVYGTRRHLAGTRGAAQALVRTMDAPHSHTEWVVQERTVTVTANVWADLPPAAPDGPCTRCGSTDHQSGHPYPVCSALYRP